MFGGRQPRLLTFQGTKCTNKQEQTGSGSVEGRGDGFPLKAIPAETARGVALQSCIPRAVLVALTTATTNQHFGYGKAGQVLAASHLSS